ncbi:RNA polymerase sigma factor sigC-like [Musa acuminata AAA Group]|uniref:RNA polymerase sigma factor sigC-like n=1 Tax=Musa acuminata AAA Group TaxID=214697 RepID=UPI0031E1B9E2
MGLRFMVVSKGWVSTKIPPPPLLPNPCSSFSSVCLLHTVGVREVYVKFVRLPLQRTVLDGGKLLHTSTLRANASLFGEIQSVEGISDNAPEAKLDGWSSRICLALDKQIPMMEASSAFHANLTVKTPLEFNLLMENIDRIEDLIAGADMVRLERDILTHIGRLGALKLFHTSCISRALMGSTVVYSDFMVNKHLSDCPSEPPLDDKKGSTIVHSGKKEKRKLRRSRAMEKASKMSSPQIFSKGRHLLKRSLLLEKTVSRKLLGHFESENRREVIARNESEMSMGVKEIANLEKICKELEEEIGRPPSYTRWAEAAGVDMRTLQWRLQFGWYCRDTLIKSTRSLVMFIAKNYRGMGIAFDDLLQAGYVGVLNGAERFDMKKGNRFSTYVQYWIRKSILAMVARHSRMIQVPVRMESMIKRIQKARRTHYNREGRQPQDEEIAKLTGLSLAKVRLSSKCSRAVGSIEQEIRDGWRTKFREITADASVGTPDEVIEKQHLRQDTLNLLQTLHPRERQVLALRYGLEDGSCKSLEEVGRLCHVTKEWIRKIEKEAWSKIRNEEMPKKLSHYRQL